MVPSQDERGPGSDVAARQKTILVVEDEVLIRMALAQELREKGYNVLEAANGDEALAILRASLRIDALLSDIRMPGSIDGIDLVRISRTERPAMKILVSSGHLAATELRGEVDGILSKPIDFDVLLARLRLLLA